MGMEKEYTGTITLGATTPTFDLESEPAQHTSVNHLTEEQIRAATSAFTGDIMQMPPIHSAIKKDGKRLYYAARSGEVVEIDPRPVTIYEFSITAIDMPFVQFRVRCSTGTYIRSLANDFGAALGVGGYLSNLRRTKIGLFDVVDAMQIANFENHIAALKGETDSKL